MAALQLGDPRSMQAACCLDRDHRHGGTVFVQCHLKLATDRRQQPSRENRQRHRIREQTRDPLLIHTRMNALPGFTATLTVDGSSANSRIDMSSLLRTGPPARIRLGAYSRPISSLN